VNHDGQYILIAWAVTIPAAAGLAALAHLIIKQLHLG